MHNIFSIIISIKKWVRMLTQMGQKSNEYFTCTAE